MSSPRWSHSLRIDDPCLQRAFGQLRLPASREVSFVHLPLRFTPFVPVVRPAES